MVLYIDFILGNWISGLTAKLGNSMMRSDHGRTLMVMSKMTGGEHPLGWIWTLSLQAGLLTAMLTHSGTKDNPTLWILLQLTSFWLWHHVVLWKDTNVLEDFAASIFRVKYPEDYGSKVLQSTGLLAHHYTASQPRRPWFEISPHWKPQNLTQGPISYTILTTLYRFLTRG
jgi:hypothetical protein